MLLNRGPSWRQGGRPQPVNEAQDLSEQRFGDSDFCELECGIAAMSHDLGIDLDQLFAQRGSPPGAALISLPGHLRRNRATILSVRTWGYSRRKSK